MAGTADEQAALWNGPAGRAWVGAQELIDRVFAPFQELLPTPVASGSRVLDVGCGAGDTTLAVARHLGAGGHAVGIDISEPLIAAARARAGRENVRATFVRADAQRHAFAPGGFDLVLSRFGVMFFDDPVGAFANLRRAGAHDAALRFIAWRAASENPFMTTAERAAAPLLPQLPARRADAPGQFALADAARVRGILQDSGWTAIDIRPIDVVCTFPEADLVPYLTRLGPVGLVLQDADETTRRRVVEAVRAAFDPYLFGSEVRFTAACWTVGAAVAQTS
jgi:SAM-dependent methyltransferase